MRILCFLFFSLVANFIFANQKLLEKLKALDVVSVEEIHPSDQFTACYRIIVKQPIDHAHPEKGSFRQKVYLSHKSLEADVLFLINGYLVPNNRIDAWAQKLDCNQISVEHRFFGQSSLDSIPWSTLNMANVTKDLHRIREIFKELYAKNWISTGISKGGLTALTYRFFFPEDVEATIAQSTSVKWEECDTTFFDYIDSMAMAQACQKKIAHFQAQLFTHRAAIIPLLKAHLTENGQSYDRLGLERIFDLAVLEVPFSVFQNKGGCSFKLVVKDDPQALFQKLSEAVINYFISDQTIENLAPYQYQAANELGYYCYPIGKWKTYLGYAEASLSALVLPEELPLHYSNDLMLQLRDWASQKAERIIYISGGLDPWAYRRIEPNEKLDALGLLLPNRHHTEVSHRYLTNDQLEQVMERLDRWRKL